MRYAPPKIASKQQDFKVEIYIFFFKHNLRTSWNFNPRGSNPKKTTRNIRGVIYLLLFYQLVSYRSGMQRVAPMVDFETKVDGKIWLSNFALLCLQAGAQISLILNLSFLVQHVPFYEVSIFIVEVLSSWSLFRCSGYDLFAWIIFKYLYFTLWPIKHPNYLLPCQQSLL